MRTKPRKRAQVIKEGAVHAQLGEVTVLQLVIRPEDDGRHLGQALGTDTIGKCRARNAGLARPR
jgi:hypothetical protein